VLALCWSLITATFASLATSPEQINQIARTGAFAAVTVAAALDIQ